MAGSEYTLTCIIQAIPGFTNIPTAQWTDTSSGNVLETGDHITVVTSPGSATLTFNPLRASDDAGYRCSGSLMTLAQGALLTISMLENLRVQSKRHSNLLASSLTIMHVCVVSTPAVTVSVNPVSPDPLVAGGVGDTVLTCSAMLNAAVNEGTILYTFTWQDRDGNAVLPGERTTISPGSPSQVSSSNLTLSPLNTADTMFTCRVVATEMTSTLNASDPGVASIPLSVISKSHIP